MAAIVAAGAAGGAALWPHGEKPEVEVTVFKKPQCECCARWADHLRANGFRVVIRDTEKPGEIRRDLGVPPALAACHTAVAADYVIEGHVPADAIREVIEDRPRVKGLAVPGMPTGSPGMEGGMRQRYRVHLFEESGRELVYQRR